MHSTAPSCKRPLSILCSSTVLFIFTQGTGYFCSSANAAPDSAEITEKLGYQKIDYHETPRGASIITKANELSSMHNPPPLALSRHLDARVAKRERMQSRGWMASWNFTPTSEPLPAPPAQPPSPRPALCLRRSRDKDPPSSPASPRAPPLPRSSTPTKTPTAPAAARPPPLRRT